MTVKRSNLPSLLPADSLTICLASVLDWIEALPASLDELERLASEMPARSPFHWPCMRAHSPHAKCEDRFDSVWPLEPDGLTVTRSQ